MKQLFYFFGFFGAFGFFGGLGSFGGFVGLVGVVETTPPSSWINAGALGDPNPVHASHPGPAENPPLFPDVMSLKLDAAFAA
jgi:hypothetical protein